MRMSMRCCNDRTCAVLDMSLVKVVQGLCSTAEFQLKWRLGTLGEQTTPTNQSPEKEKDQLLPAILSETGETSSISKWPTRIMIGDSTIPERNITVEELALPFLVKLLKYFGDYKLKNSEVNFRIICFINLH